MGLELLMARQGPLIGRCRLLRRLERYSRLFRLFSKQLDGIGAAAAPFVGRLLKIFRRYQFLLL